MMNYNELYTYIYIYTYVICMSKNKSRYIKLCRVNKTHTFPEPLPHRSSQVPFDLSPATRPTHASGFYASNCGINQQEKIGH